VDAPAQGLRRRGREEAAEPFPPGRDILPVDSQDDLADTDVRRFAVGAAPDVRDDGPAFDPFHLDSRQVGPEILSEAGLLEKPWVSRMFVTSSMISRA